MNIAIVGYGKMGRQIEELINNDSKHQIVSITCREIGQGLTPGDLKDVDVAIDFSNAELMTRHIEIYTQTDTSAVIGTTGWDVDDPRIIKLINESNIGVVVGSNFSISLQIFLQLIAQAARQFSNVSGYDVYGLEIHHAQKADSPSGTAKTITETIVNNFPSKNYAEYDRVNRQIDPEALHFASVRGGENRGYHQVIFDSIADEVSLSHAAHSRVGFASGAIKAAEWVTGRQGYFKFQEIFNQGEANE